MVRFFELAGVRAADQPPAPRPQPRPGKESPGGTPERRGWPGMPMPKPAPAPSPQPAPEKKGLRRSRRMPNERL